MRGPDESRRLDARWILVGVLLTSIAAGIVLHDGLPPDRPSDGWVIPPGREAVVRSLVATPEGEVMTFANGLSLTGIRIVQKTVEFQLGRGANADAGMLIVHHVSSAPAEARRGRHLAVSTRLVDVDDRAARHALDRAVASVLQHDDVELFVVVTTEPVAVKPEWTLRVQLFGFSVLSALLAFVALIVGLRRRKRAGVWWVGRFTHLLPAGLQCIIFAYWFAHWPDGRGFVLPIVAQIPIAYAIDLSLSIIIRGGWTASFGVVPIVLSTHLLAQFQFDMWWAGMVAVLVGLLVKALIRREGRPLFNPSGFGLSFIALVDLFSDGVKTPDFAAEFAAPPNMTELVVVLALIVHIRLKLTLVTLSAAASLGLASMLSPHQGFGIAWAPVTLVLCLLITDPSTIPKSSGGRILYGAFIGVGMVIIQAILVALGHTDFWAKVLALPIANYFVPAFDRWGAKLNVRSLVAPRYNALHIGAWAVVLALAMSGKGGWIEDGGVQSAMRSPCWKGALASDPCEANPMFCTPFSLRSEIVCWRARLGP